MTFEEKRNEVVVLMTYGAKEIIKILQNAITDLESEDDELIYARCMYIKALVDYMGTPNGMRADIEKQKVAVEYEMSRLKGLH